MLLVLVRVLLQVGGAGRETGRVVPGWAVEEELGSVLEVKGRGSCCLPSGCMGSAGCAEGDMGKCKGAEGLGVSHGALETGTVRSAGFSLAGVPMAAGSGLGTGGCCEGGAIGAGRGGGDVELVGAQLRGTDAACAAEELLAVLVMAGAVPDLGSAEKSCFRTEVGVGVFEGAVLVGEAVEPGATAAVDTRAGCSAVAGVELEGRGAALLVCLGELLALPGLTGRTGNGPHVFGEGEKVPPNCAMGRRG